MTMTPTPAIARAAERIVLRYATPHVLEHETSLAVAILTAELSPLSEALAVVTKERDAAVSRAIAAENFPPRVRDRLRLVKWKDAGHHCEAKSAVHAVLQMIAALLPARGEGSK